MRSTLDKNKDWKRLNRDRLKSSDLELSFQSCFDDDLIEDNLRQRVRSLESSLFAEYCSELPNFQLEQLCSRR